MAVQTIKKYKVLCMLVIISARTYQCDWRGDGSRYHTNGAGWDRAIQRSRAIVEKVANQ